MRTIRIEVDAATEARLKAIAAYLERSINDLCEAAVSEAALDHYRGCPTVDPGREVKS